LFVFGSGAREIVDVQPEGSTARMQGSKGSGFTGGEILPRRSLVSALRPPRVGTEHTRAGRYQRLAEEEGREENCSSGHEFAPVCCVAVGRGQYSRVIEVWRQPRLIVFSSG
jgi:hypothetical protein